MQQNQTTTAKVGKNSVFLYENANESAKIKKAQSDILHETDVTNYSVQSVFYSLNQQIFATFLSWLRSLPHYLR